MIYALRVLAKDFLQTSRVVLSATVVVEDTILLLLNVGELSVAVAPNVVAE